MSGTSLEFIFSNLISGTYSGSSIVFDPTGEKLILPEGNRVTVFDISKGQSQTLQIEHQSTITHVCMSENGQYMVTSDRKNYVRITCLNNNGFEYQKKMKKEITALAFAPNGKGFIVASANKLTLFKDPSETTSLKPFVSQKRVGGHYSDVHCVKFSKDGKLFVSCSSDMTVRLFITEPDEDFVPVTLAGHRGKPVMATFLDDNKIMSVGQDGSVFIWEIADDFTISIVSKRRLDEESFDSPKNKFQNVVAADFLDGNLVAGFHDGTFKIYPMPNYYSILNSSISVKFSNERVSNVAISKKYAAFTSAKLGELVVWDLINGTVAQRTLSHFGGVTSFAYSPNGVIVATCGDDGKLKIWDTQNGSCLMTFNEHKAPINDVAFGESGRTVVTASFDGTCKAFDVVNGRCFRTFTVDEHKEFSKIAVDSHCEFVAACSRGGMEIYLWSMSTGKLLDVLTGHSAPICSLAFTPLMKLVSGSWDGTSRVWDFLDSHSSVGLDANGEVTDIAVSPDGKTLCIANSTGRLIMYNPETNEYLGEIEISNDARGGKLYDEEISAKSMKWYFDSIDFSPDGNFIVCGGKTKYICVYNVQRRLLMRRITHTVNEEFSGVEKYIKKYHGSGIAQQVLEANLGKREIIAAASRCVRWCPTGLGFSAATPEGLLVYITADQKIVDPIELETDITPSNVETAVKNKEWVKAVIMSIRLGHTESKLLNSVITNIPSDGIEFVANHIPTKYVSDLIQFLAEALKSTQQVGLILKWINAILKFHSHSLLKIPAASPSSRLLQKSLSSRVEYVKNIAFNNYDLMNFLCNNQYQEE